MKRIIKNISVLLLISVLLTAFCSVTAGALSADANNDGVTDISDCTTIQMYIAGYKIEYNSSFDVDENGTVDINDATYLQALLSKPGASTEDTATADIATEDSPAVAPTSITLNKTSATLKVGNTLSLSANVNAGAETGILSWSSSNPEVAVITATDGNKAEIKAMKLGTATITVKTYNGIEMSCKINVSGSDVKCLDVSTFQETIDFEKVKNDGYDYVIIRAGYGKDPNQEDDLFATNYENAKAAGLKVGAYWYSYATSVSEAAEEADNCLASIKGKDFDLPIFFDIEEKVQSTLSKSVLTGMADKFCSIIESNGFKAGIYSTKYILGKMDVDSLQKKYAIWLSQVDGDFNNITADVHQFTWTHKVDGIIGNVDCNYIYNLNIVKA